jgi:large subunit ribosomal protein L23
MDYSRIILGPVVTEKAERLKADAKHRTYTLRVMPSATKVDVRRALESFYDVQVASVRALRVRAKSRDISPYQSMEKRHNSRKVMVTLSSDSKPLDLSAFKKRD